MNKPLQNQNALQQISSRLNEIIEPLCEGYSEYALLDFPAHSNVGDSAIYLGEIKLFDKIFDRPASYVCTIFDPDDDLDIILPDGIIFLHGGGNFGDIWPVHQIYRDKILRRYPHRKIVQLPQSLHFSSQIAIENTASAIENHDDFTLLVRDKEGFEFARSHFDCDVILCPDVAYALSKTDFAHKKPIREVLCLLRNDKEQFLSESDRNILEELGDVQDWQVEKRVKSIADRVNKLVFSYLPGSRMRLMPAKEQMFRRHAWIRLNCGTVQIASANWLVSDRLHVHILAMIMGKNHVALDNNYGKIHNFINAWPKDDTTHLVQEISELTSILGSSHTV